MRKYNTAHEINERFGVTNKNANVVIDGLVQNTIVYTLDDVNKILNSQK